jgi:hypothetical protein
MNCTGYRGEEISPSKNTQRPALKNLNEIKVI